LVSASTARISDGRGYHADEAVCPEIKTAGCGEQVDNDQDDLLL